jgi:tetratricopeptide (TPR) repeat protein
MATKIKTTSATPAVKIDLFEPDELVALARLNIERGEVDEALRKLKQVITEPNPPAESLAMAARIYAQLGLLERAKPLFERYLETQPNAVNETFQFGMVHFDAGQQTEALKIWDGLLKSQPTHPPALFYRALALHQLGQSPEARHSLDILLKSAAPDNLYFNRAKELLQAIEHPQTALAGRGAAPAEAMRVAPKDAYKTEH